MYFLKYSGMFWKFLEYKNYILDTVLDDFGILWTLLEYSGVIWKCLHLQNDLKFV